MLPHFHNIALRFPFEFRVCPRLFNGQIFQSYNGVSMADSVIPNLAVSRLYGG
jgi:hypothetical protein